MKLIIALLLTFATTIFADSLPEAFYGHFTVDHSENFDEYLEAKGYGFFTRKLIAFSKFDKVFTKAGGGTFNYDNLTTKKDVHYKNIVLGKPFVGEGLDSTKHRVTFSLRGGKLYEHHVPLDANAEAKEEEYVYTPMGNQLVMTMEANGVVGKRYYKHA